MAHSSNMDSKLDESSRSTRDSITYDDIASEGDLSQDSVTASEDAHQKSDSNDTKRGDVSIKTPSQGALEISKPRENKESNGDSKAGETSRSVDGEVGKKLEKEDAIHTSKEGREDKRKFRKDSHDKELWTPVKGDGGKRGSDEALSDSSGDHPTKPPRRHTQKKAEIKDKNGAESGKVEQKSSPVHSSESDPVKPPTRRRHLPQPLIPGTMPKPNTSGKKEIKVDSTTSDNELSASGDHSDQQPREIVCNPVLTSSPNQDKIPSLSVEMVDTIDTSRRVLSYLDVSSVGGTGTTKRVESFYDFLYSKDGNSSVADATSPILRDGDRVGDTLSHSDEHLYDDVPAEDSITESFNQKSHLGSTYEEVIVNQGKNVWLKTQADRKSRPG